MSALPAVSRVDDPDQVSSRRSNDHFVNLTAHELRNPLRAMALDAEYLARHLQTGTTSSQNPNDLGEIADRMAVTAQRMSEQVNDLLALVTGSTSPRSAELIELGPLLNETMSDFDAELKRIKATVVVGPLPAVLGHRPSIRMLFRNLVGNAIRHRHPNRRLRLNISTKSYPLDDGQNLIYLAVADNGRGVSPADHHRIFEPYARASDRRDGIGLGLAICDRVVERMGGTIHVESDGETGSTFVILIHGPINKP